MRLQMRGVDHDPLRLAALAGQFGENLVEHAQAAPAHEPIVDCLVRAIVGRSIAPAQPVLDHKHDRADDPPVLKPERSRATAENTPRSDASEPETTKTNLPWRSILASPRNQPIRRSERTLMGPEPSWRRDPGPILAGPLARRRSCQHNGARHRRPRARGKARSLAFYGARRRPPGPDRGRRPIGQT